MGSIWEKMKPAPTGGLKRLGFRDGKLTTVEADNTTDTTTGLDGDRLLARKAEGHKQLHLLHVANAAKTFKELPADGWTYHGIMAGMWNAWDVVPAVLRLAEPATITNLHVATLGFNEANAHELMTLLDEKKIGTVTFICSHYFRGTSGHIYEPLAAGLKKRGQRIAAIRCHAKILAMRLNDGRHLVWHSSANLRSCRNVEQFDFTHSKDLYDFDVAALDELLAAAPPEGIEGDSGEEQGNERT